MWKQHARFERHSLWLVLGIIVVVSIGGLVEISPLFYLESTIEEVDGVRPYTPLEQAGRDIYVREGCYLCHSQMIRPLRDEVERYGHYSLAAESMYDHPFQWGSKRTGPDLARVGGKYSDSWHVDHLRDPRSVVPESNMPPYAFLAKRELDYRAIDKHLATLTRVGVPYTKAQLANARADLEQQVDPFAGETSDLKKRYGAKVQQRDFDGDPSRITELDALIAYLQVLGTMVDFRTYKAEDPENLR
ncbi:cytochrome-c oxidase, cbb3-type subunit II [Phenylobacterium sp.]|uniref:cytochrome-c oxidase, cbb3-type subunit II n=1 Tax=Phenylobacterium sp. TaxID=1871053 RepID=UPI003BAC48B8